MGFFTCDPRHYKLSNAEESEQVVSENEGVSIFFGKSSIESVKSLVGKRINSITRHLEEGSSGSVARKAALFDHYIRSVSLEKATTTQMQVQETGSDEEDRHVPGEQVDHVHDSMDMDEASCSKPDHVEETTAHIDEEEDEEATVLQELTEVIMLKVQTVPQVVPATETSAVVQSKRSKPSKKQHEQPTSTSNGNAEVVNRWRSKNGLIPGVRAANKPQAQPITAKQSTGTSTKPSTAPRRTTTNNKTAGKANKNETPAPSVTAKEKSSTKLTAAANGFNFRSNERAEKRKEFNRKMEEKLNAKVAEKNKLQAKTEEETQAEIKELRRTLNFKATPMPGFYQPTKSENRKLGSRAKAEEKPSNEQASTKTKKVTTSRQQQQHHHLTKSKASSAITVSS